MKEVHSQLQDPSFKPAAGLKSFAALRISESLENVQLPAGTPAALGYGGKTAELAPGVSAALGYGGKLGALDPGTPAALGYGGKTAELAPGSPVALGYGGAQTPLNSLKNLETTVNSLLQMTDLLNSRNTDLR